MARIRYIKPDFFLHEGLARLSPTHRLLFIGLWTLADREGRLEDRPDRIRAQLFPYESVDVGAMLDDLAAVDHLIARYEVDERAYVAVTNFPVHQRPHVREAPSIIPPPPPEARPGLCLGTTQDMPGHNLGSKSPLTIPSLSLRAESLLQAGSSPAPGAKRRSGAPAAVVDGFEEFWARYPRKVGKPAAGRAWRNQRLGQADAPVLLAAIEAHTRSQQWADPNFIPHPATWLNQRRWEDEAPPDIVPGPRVAPTHDYEGEYLRRKGLL